MASTNPDIKAYARESAKRKCSVRAPCSGAAGRACFRFMRTSPTGLRERLLGDEDAGLARRDRPLVEAADIPRAGTFLTAYGVILVLADFLTAAAGECKY